VEPSSTRKIISCEQSLGRFTLNPLQKPQGFFQSQVPGLHHKNTARTASTWTGHTVIGRCRHPGQIRTELMPDVPGGLSGFIADQEPQIFCQCCETGDADCVVSRSSQCGSVWVEAAMLTETWLSGRTGLLGQGCRPELPDIWNKCVCPCSG
jgi:hypothetical protein